MYLQLFRGITARCLKTTYVHTFLNSRADNLFPQRPAECVAFMFLREEDDCCDIRKYFKLGIGALAQVTLREIYASLTHVLAL